MQASLSLIKQFTPIILKAEYSKERDTYYIGYNQTLNVYNGLVWTFEQAHEDLVNEVTKIQKVLAANFHGALTQWQSIALTSLIHDIGIEEFLRSDLPKHLRNRNYILASNAFMQFNKRGRVVSVAKATRRKEEQLIFNKK